MTYGYQNGYNPGYNNQQQGAYGQQQQYPAYQAQQPQQPVMRTVAPQGTQHLLPVIDRQLNAELNGFLTSGSPQRASFAQVALTYNTVNPKFNGMVFDIAEWLDMTCRQSGQHPDQMVVDKVKHFAAIAACASTLEHRMTQGLDQNALAMVQRSADEYHWIIRELDRLYGQSAQAPQGFNNYQGVSLAQATGTMNNVQQQPLFNPPPQQQQFQTYQDPNFNQQQSSYSNYAAPGPVGTINQFAPPPTTAPSAGRYLDTSDFVVDTTAEVNYTAKKSPEVQPMTQQPVQTYPDVPMNAYPVSDGSHGDVSNFIDEITITPTAATYVNHTAAQDNTRMQATNRLILNNMANRHPALPRRKKIPTVFNVNTTVALLEQTPAGDWDEMFAGLDTESTDKLKLRGINVEYVDFETEKLVHARTNVDVDRVPDTGLAFKTMEAAVVSKSVDELLKDMENEGGVADGEVIDLPEAVRLDHAIAVLENADVYNDIAITLADKGIDIGSSTHAICAPTVVLRPFASTRKDWLEDIRNASNSNEVIRLLDDAREWMGEYHWNKIHQSLTDNTNFLLKAEFLPGYSIDSYALDTVDLYKIVKNTLSDAEIALFKRIGKRTIEMTFNAFTKEQFDQLCGVDGHAVEAESFTFGAYVPTVLLPVYGADLGIAFAGDKGIVTKTRMPQLFDLIQNELGKVDASIPVYHVNIITKDAHIIKVYMNLDGERVILR